MKIPDENGELRCIREIQGYSGGITKTELVTIRHKWKPLIITWGRARDQDSIAEAGLMVGGEECKEDQPFSALLTRCIVLDPLNHST